MFRTISMGPVPPHRCKVAAPAGSQLAACCPWRSWLFKLHPSTAAAGLCSISVTPAPLPST